MPALMRCFSKPGSNAILFSNQFGERELGSITSIIMLVFPVSLEIEWIGPAHYISSETGNTSMMLDVIDPSCTFAERIAWRTKLHWSPVLKSSALERGIELHSQGKRALILTLDPAKPVPWEQSFTNALGGGGGNSFFKGST